MRFNLTRDPVADTQVFEFPWNPEIKLTIRRWGHPAFQKGLAGRQRRATRSALERYLSRDGLTLRQMRKLKPEDLHAKFDEMPMADALDLIEDIEPKDAVALVESVHGLTADGTAVKWSEEVGVDLFLQLPRAQLWVQQQAKALEEDFLAVVEAVSGNSRATSGGSPEVADPATSSSTTPTSCAPTAAASSPSGESAAG